MKQWKRVIASVLSFAVILAGFYVSPKAVEAAAATQFYAEGVTAEPGEEIQVPVKIKGNTGIAGFEIDVRYDKEVLTPINEVVKSDLLKGQFENGIEVALDSNADSFNVLWAGTDNMTEDGVVFTLKFQVSDQASGSTNISLTVKDEDLVYDENLENVPVDCQPVTVNIESGQPDKPTKPSEEPSLPPAETDYPDTPPAETNYPYTPPIETDEPTEIATAEIYLDYWSDFDRTQEIDGFGQADYTVVVDGNGEYQVSFVATASTDNIYRLCLQTYLDPEDLPAGMKIVPTTLQVGEKIYTIGECQEEYTFGYEVSIQDLLYGRDSIEGDVPVAVGDTVTLKFRIEGMKRDGTLGISTNPPAPTETAAAQNTDQPKTTKAAATKKPSSTTEPETTSKPVKLKKPKKVKLKKVKALGKGKARVSWKWFVSQSGFQLQYAQNRSFTKKKKTKKKNMFTDTVTVKKLKKGKTYYFRVRAFNKSGSKKKYGKWSKVKKCKIK